MCKETRKERLEPVGSSTLKGKEMEEHPIKMNEKEHPERWVENWDARDTPGPGKRECQEENVTNDNCNIVQEHRI